MSRSTVHYVDNKINNVFVTFITSYGLITNQYSSQYVQSDLTMDHLFVDI